MNPTSRQKPNWGMTPIANPVFTFFGTGFWIGFVLHLIYAEVWINYTRPGTDMARQHKF